MADNTRGVSGTSGQTVPAQGNTADTELEKLTLQYQNDNRIKRIAENASRQHNQPISEVDVIQSLYNIQKTDPKFSNTTFEDMVVLFYAQYAAPTDEVSTPTQEAGESKGYNPVTVKDAIEKALQQALSGKQLISDEANGIKEAIAKDPSLLTATMLDNLIALAEMGEQNALWLLNSFAENQATGRVFTPGHVKKLVALAEKTPGTIMTDGDPHYIWFIDIGADGRAILKNREDDGFVIGKTDRGTIITEKDGSYFEFDPNLQQMSQLDTLPDDVAALNVYKEKRYPPLIQATLSNLTKNNPGIFSDDATNKQVNVILGNKAETERAVKYQRISKELETLKTPAQIYDYMDAQILKTEEGWGFEANVVPLEKLIVLAEEKPAYKEAIIQRLANASVTDLNSLKALEEWGKRNPNDQVLIATALATAIAKTPDPKDGWRLSQCAEYLVKLPVEDNEQVYKALIEGGSNKYSLDAAARLLKRVKEDDAVIFTKVFNLLFPIIKEEAEGDHQAASNMLIKLSKDRPYTITHDMLKALYSSGVEYLTINGANQQVIVTHNYYAWETLISVYYELPASHPGFKQTGREPTVYQMLRTAAADKDNPNKKAIEALLFIAQERSNDPESRKILEFLEQQEKDGNTKVIEVKKEQGLESFL